MGECPLNPLTVHALVHVNSTLKSSQHRHIRKGAFLAKNATELISDRLNFKNLLGVNVPRPLACCVLAVHANIFATSLHFGKSQFDPLATIPVCSRGVCKQHPISLEGKV